VAVPDFEHETVIETLGGQFLGRSDGEGADRLDEVSGSQFSKVGVPPGRIRQPVGVARGDALVEIVFGGMDRVGARLLLGTFFEKFVGHLGKTMVFFLQRVVGIVPENEGHTRFNILTGGLPRRSDKGRFET